MKRGRDWHLTASASCSTSWSLITRSCLCGRTLRRKNCLGATTCHQSLIRVSHKFKLGGKIILIYLDQHYPVNTYSFVFFIKSNNNDDVTDNDRKKITMDGIETQLICDFVETEPLDDLLTRMNGDYLNKFLGENDWPEGVKKDFVASLHTFMATVTE